MVRRHALVSLATAFALTTTAACAGVGGKGDDSLDGGDGIDECRQGKGTGASVSCE